MNFSPLGGDRHGRHDHHGSVERQGAAASWKKPFGFIPCPRAIGLGIWVLVALILMRESQRRCRAAPNSADRAIHQAALISMIG